MRGTDFLQRITWIPCVRGAVIASAMTEGSLYAVIVLIWGKIIRCTLAFPFEGKVSP